MVLGLVVVGVAVATAAVRGEVAATADAVGGDDSESVVDWLIVTRVNVIGRYT